MHTTNKSNKKVNHLTGNSNIGNLYRYIQFFELSVYEQVTIMAIGRYSIGYCRPTTNVPSDKGHNRNSKAWADSIGISKTSFLNAVKSLAAKQLLVVHTGSNFRLNGGSYPDYYSIKFNPDLQKQHKVFFNLGTIDELEQAHQPEFVCPPTTDYILQNGRIVAISSIAPDKLKLLAERNMLVHPTVEQLTNHLKEL